MKIAHLADLHIGRKFGTYDLIEDQRAMLNQIIELLKKEAVETVMIAGDIYDKVNPSEQAFSLWNEFITALESAQFKVLIISGNHDSAQRLGIGSGIFAKRNIHIASIFTGTIEKVVLEDEYGPINFYLLPFIKPSMVRNKHENFEGRTYQEAVAFLLDNLEINSNQRNILMAHQFVIANTQNPMLSDSEVGQQLGGLESIDASLFDEFDYVALGHIHKPQAMGRQTVRYSGSMLKYSFSEAQDHKSIPILNFTEDLTMDKIPLIPKKDVRVIKGPLDALVSIAQREPSDDLIHAIITDETPPYDPIGMLRVYYPNVLTLELQNSQTEQSMILQKAEDILEKTDIDLFNDFFFLQNAREMNEEETNYLQAVMEEII